MKKQYWLMKSEPDVFSIDDLKEHPKQTTQWEGVRNYQARNFMRDQMKKGDKILFYHSNCQSIGIVGVATVSKEAYPDHFSWDPKSKYFDPKSTKENPRWFMVDVTFDCKFKRVIELQEIKKHPTLKNMQVAKKGQRLSIQPVTSKEFEQVLKLSQNA